MSIHHAVVISKLTYRGDIGNRFRLIVTFDFGMQFLTAWFEPVV